ncbi:MAG: hypothetical protein R2702_08105 [Acidimicrobiales bacterium]
MATALVGLVAVAPLHSGGCTSTACGDCGSGVAVWWRPGDLPAGGTFELCVNDACEVVEPAPLGGDGRLLGVSPSAATGERQVGVLLTVRDESGEIVRQLGGAGRKVGDCCPGIELRAGAGDRLTVEHGSD